LLETRRGKFMPQPGKDMVQVTGGRLAADSPVHSPAPRASAAAGSNTPSICRLIASSGAKPAKELQGPSPLSNQTVQPTSVTRAPQHERAAAGIADHQLAAQRRHRSSPDSKASPRQATPDRSPRCALFFIICWTS
jgi:hypothetical protein